jgi:hypothetical protein
VLDKFSIQAEVIALCPAEPIINLKVRLLEPRPTTMAATTAIAFTSTPKP